MQLIGIVLLLLVGLSGSRDLLGKKRAWPGYFITPQRDSDRETGNPLVVDAACGAGLSGLFRRSFNED